MNNPNSYRDSLLDILEDKMNLPTTGLIEKTYENGRLFYKKETYLPANMTIAGKVVLGMDVTLQEDVYLENCAIGANSVVGEKTKIVNSILWEHVTIGPNCRIKNSVLCNR